MSNSKNISTKSFNILIASNIKYIFVMHSMQKIWDLKGWNSSRNRNEQAPRFPHVVFPVGKLPNNHYIKLDKFFITFVYLSNLKLSTQINVRYDNFAPFKKSTHSFIIQRKV